MFPDAFSGCHSQAHAFGLAQWSLSRASQRSPNFISVTVMLSARSQAAAKDRTSVAQLRPRQRHRGTHFDARVSSGEGTQRPLAPAGLPDPQARSAGPPARWNLAEPDPAGAATRLTGPLASLPSCPGSGAALGAPPLPQPARRAPRGSLSAPGSEQGALELTAPRSSLAPAPGKGERSPGRRGHPGCKGIPGRAVLPRGNRPTGPSPAEWERSEPSPARLNGSEPSQARLS